jgi:tight adherence protein C
MTVFTLLLVLMSLALAAAFIRTRQITPARERLVRLADGSKAPIQRGHNQTQVAPGIIREDHPAWLLRFFDILSKFQFEPDNQSHRLRQKLTEAGLRSPSAVTIFLGSRIIIAFTLPLLVSLIPATWQLERNQMLVLLGVTTAFGYALPGYFIDKRRAARQRSIEHSLPDSLDLMVVCVQAGLGITAAISRITRELAETHPIMVSELQLCLFETHAGKSTTQALRSMADRTGVSELSTLVAMLIQTERFGTNIADTLRIHADSMRCRRMERAEELAAKAPLKMLFPTTLIFASTLLVTIGPAVSGIFKSLTDIG